MDGLPHEIQRVIFGHLDVNDLAKCGRVSRDLGQRATEVLSSITCIYTNYDCSDDMYTDSQLLSSVIRRSAPKNTSYKAWFTDENTRSFLRFVTKKCPRLSSLIASSCCVHIEDISPLGDRVTFFLLGNIITKGKKYGVHTIDAETLAFHFPKLKFYHLSHGHYLCPNEVASAYSLRVSTHLLKYEDYCRNAHTCQSTVDVRSIDNLISICVESPLVLRELRSSSLASLQFLQLIKPPSDKGDLPHLPNLLYATLFCGENLNRMIHLLHNSPKLSALILWGEINQLSIAAFNVLLSNCTALKVFQLTCFTDDHAVVDNPDRFLDFSHSKSLKDVDIARYLVSAGLRKMAIPVILPPDCDSIRCFSTGIRFNRHGSEYSFDYPAVSLKRIRPFSHPIGLEIEEQIKRLAGRILRLCPQVSRLTFRIGSDESSLQLGPIFEDVLAKTDVSDIVIDFYFATKGSSIARAFFGEINEYPGRSFLVTMRSSHSGFDFQSMLKVLSRKYTTSLGNARGQFEMFVEIPPAVNGLSTRNAEN